MVIKKEYVKERRQKNKEKKKEYNKKYQKENKEKLKQYQKKYYQRPDVKTRIREYGQTPKRKVQRKIYRQKPEVKKRKKEYKKRYMKKPGIRDKYKAYMKIYNQKLEVKAKRKEYNHSQKAKEWQRVYWEKNKKKIRTYQLKHNFNLASKDYLRMTALQNNKCAICGNEEKFNKKGKVPQLVVDHNHKTGIIRGLLCKRCNLVLGNVNEDISLLQKMIKYLKSFEEIKGGVENG